MKKEDYELKLLSEKMEERLNIFRDRLIEDFLERKIEIKDILRNRWLLLFSREEKETFFQNINQADLNYHDKVELLDFDDVITYKKLRNHFFLILKEKINENKQVNNNNKIIPIEVNQPVERVLLSRTIELVHELFPPNYLFDLIPPEKVKAFEFRNSIYLN